MPSNHINQPHPPAASKSLIAALIVLLLQTDFLRILTLTPSAFAADPQRAAVTSAASEPMPFRQATKDQPYTNKELGQQAAWLRDHSAGAIDWQTQMVNIQSTQNQNIESSPTLQRYQNEYNAQVKDKSFSELQQNAHSIDPNRTDGYVGAGNMLLNSATSRPRLDLTKSEPMRVAREVFKNISETQNEKCQVETTIQTRLGAHDANEEKQCVRTKSAMDSCTLYHEIGQAQGFETKSGDENHITYATITVAYEAETGGINSENPQSYLPIYTEGTYINRKYDGLYISQRKTYYQEDKCIKYTNGVKSNVCFLEEKGVGEFEGGFASEVKIEPGIFSVKIKKSQAIKKIRNIQVYLQISAHKPLSQPHGIYELFINDQPISGIYKKLSGNEFKINEYDPTTCKFYSWVNRYDCYFEFQQKKTINNIDYFNDIGEKINFNYKHSMPIIEEVKQDKWYPQQCLDKIKEWMKIPACRSTSQTIRSWEYNSDLQKYIGISKNVDFGAEFVDPADQDANGCITDNVSDKIICPGDAVYEKIPPPPLPGLQKLWQSVQFRRPACADSSDCQTLEDEGCKETARACSVESQDLYGTTTCDREHATMTCPKPLLITEEEVKETTVCVGDPPCVDGSCQEDLSEEVNDGLIAATAGLAMAQSIASEVTETEKNTEIFNGEIAECSILYDPLTGKKVNDCCKTPKGSLSLMDYMQGVAYLNKITQISSFPKYSSSNPAIQVLVDGVYTISEKVNSVITGTEEAISKGYDAAAQWGKTIYEKISGKALQSSETVAAGVDPQPGSLSEGLDSLSSGASALLSNTYGLVQSGLNAVGQSIGAGPLGNYVFNNVTETVSTNLSGQVVKTVTNETTGQIVQSTYTKKGGEWTVDVLIKEGETEIAKKTGEKVASDQIPQEGAKQSIQFSGLLNSIMAAYAIYQIYTMVIDLLATCKKEDFETSTILQTKTTVFVGAYSDSTMRDVRVYCKYKSPIAMVIMKQTRKMLGGFGDPENPDCSGLTLYELSQIDWDKIDWKEWEEIIMASGLVPSSSEQYLERLTGSGSTLLPANSGGLASGTSDRNNAVERLEGTYGNQTQEVNLDTINQSMRNSFWSY